MMQKHHEDEFKRERERERELTNKDHGINGAHRGICSTPCMHVPLINQSSSTRHHCRRDLYKLKIFLSWAACTQLIKEQHRGALIILYMNAISMSSSPSDPPPVVVEDCAGLLRVYSDGSVVRSPEPAILVPVLDDGTVGWKDVLFSPGHDLRLRLYRPRPRAAAGGSGPPAPPRKLPVVFYFRGGGFCVGSRAWPNFHNYCLRLASELGAVVISPDYRLAPEHRLPAALDDALAALLWLRSQAAAGEGGADPWLAEAADFGRVFVCGDSSGGNLAHHLAVRFASAPGRSGLAPVRIRGFVLLMPFFGGTAPARSEAECPPDAFLSREVCDQFWRLSIPAGATLDHPLVNPFGLESPDLEPAEFDPTVVVVGGRDLLRDRAVEYANRLGELGKPVELVEFEGAEHGFFTFQPRSEPANRLMGVLKRFVDSNGDSCRAHG